MKEEAHALCLKACAPCQTSELNSQAASSHNHKAQEQTEPTRPIETFYEMPPLMKRNVNKVHFDFKRLIAD